GDSSSAPPGSLRLHTRHQLFPNKQTPGDGRRAFCFFPPQASDNRPHQAHRAGPLRPPVRAATLRREVTAVASRGRRRVMPRQRGIITSSARKTSEALMPLQPVKAMGNWRLACLLAGWEAAAPDHPERAGEMAVLRGELVGRGKTVADIRQMLDLVGRARGWLNPPGAEFEHVVGD